MGTPTIWSAFLRCSARGRRLAAVAVNSRASGEGLRRMGPKSVRKKVGHAGEALPVGGGGSEAVIEAGIEDEVGTGGIAEREQRTNGVAAGSGLARASGRDQRLGDVPELSGEFELIAEAPWQEVVRDGDGLVALGAPEIVGERRGSFRCRGCAGLLQGLEGLLLTDTKVGVVVELTEISADEEVCGLGVAADVDVGSGAEAKPAVVAEGDGGAEAGFEDNKTLNAEQKIAGVAGGCGGAGGVEEPGLGEGLREGLHHEAGMDG